MPPRLRARKAKISSGNVGLADKTPKSLAAEKRKETSEKGLKRKQSTETDEARKRKRIAPQNDTGSEEESVVAGDGRADTAKRVGEDRQNDVYRQGEVDSGSERTTDEVPTSKNYENGDEKGDEKEEKKKSYRELTLKEIISGVGVDEAIPMPSAVKREEERKRIRKDAREKREKEKRGLCEEMGKDEGHWDAGNKDDKDKKGDRTREAGGDEGDSSGSGSEGDSLNSDEDNEDNGLAAPKVMLDENGKIVLDKSSLVVSTGSVVNHEAETTAITRVENNKFGSNITSASFAKKERAVKWLPTETEKFYEGLRLFGTDFSMIEKLLPGRSRRVIKRKFKREEKLYPDKIEQVLHGPRKQMSLKDFREQAGFGDMASSKEKTV